MIQHPIFKPHLSVQIIPGEGVLLLSEQQAPRALHGALHEALAPLLNGQHGVDAIVDALAPRFQASHVYYALAMLEKNGHITNAAPHHDGAQGAFWSGLHGAAPQPVQAQRVRLHTVGDVDPAPLRKALQALGIDGVDAQAATDESAALDVVLTDDYQRQALQTLAASLRQQGRPWLPVRLQGHESWLGPLYQPGATGCHACVVQRLARNQLVHAYAARKQGRAEPAVVAKAALASTLAAAAALAATEVAKHLAGASTALQGQLVSLNHSSLQTQAHRVVPHTHCPVCGQPAARPAPQPVLLEHRKAGFKQDGGHRSVPPEKTLQRYAHLVSPITGVVSRLMPVYEAEGVAHVYMAGHNTTLRTDSLDFLKRGLRNASSGKGVSESQAKVSALCEAIERYSGEPQGGEVLCTASLAQMRERHGADVLHPNAVMGYSERQLDEREAWNARKSKFNVVPARLDASTPIDWSAAWSVTHQRHKYLPTQLLYFRAAANEQSDVQSDAFYAMGCSNGNASGNNLEEAILQGFFELVERDATALWWYNRLPRPGVVVDSFGEPWLLDLQSYYATQGRHIWALDLTSDLGIPAFVALSRLTEGPQQRILLGLGCHLDARIALQRAFAEMNQMLGMSQPLEGEAASDLEDAEVQWWLTQATVENQPYLLPDPQQTPRTRADYPVQHSGDLLTDITHCRSIIEAKGLEMLVLDQTRADVGLPVVKVLVPGLRHFWARLGPGRLYDVPVQMGWLAKPKAEDEMNPVPIFF